VVMVRCLPTRFRPSELDTCCTAPSKGIDRLTAGSSDCELFWPYWRPAGQLSKNPFGYRNHPESEGRTGPIPRFLVNLSLSSLTGLADGLALKDRATQRRRCDSPQLLVPPLSAFRLAEIQRKCARHCSKAAHAFHRPFGWPSSLVAPKTGRRVVSRRPCAASSA
jgi:hypothetical protein